MSFVVVALSRSDEEITNSQWNVVEDLALFPGVVTTGETGCCASLVGLSSSIFTAISIQ